MLAMIKSAVNTASRERSAQLDLAVSVDADVARRGETAYATLRTMCAGDLQRVNTVILEEMQSEVGLIPQLAGHLIGAGGKRLRPLLTLASARLSGYHGDRHIGLAAAVEFIHTATLLHDDVVDQSDLRRGQGTANAVWGNKPSVLVGDFLFSRAFQLMVRSRSLRVLEILSNASAVIAEGEVAQLITANDVDTGMDDYLAIVAAKTAALFAAACQVGGVVADTMPLRETALEAYGNNLGIAFQLMDDYLDYAAREAELGKSLGDDFRDGKITMPVILAYHRGDATEQEFWRRTLERQEVADGDFTHARQLLVNHSALDDTVAAARGYADAAREALNVFPDGQPRQVLADIADFCVERAF